MPLELGVWRIDRGLEAVDAVSLDLESRLEDILERDISIASPDWMVIGRQVQTSFGKVIDLLCINSQGDLAVLELKRDKTYRDIVAQVLDYGSWIRELRDDDIAKIFGRYRSKYHADDPDQSLDAAFMKRFSLSGMPDELNANHELVIVASTLDHSTERVVNYLSSEHDVSINAIFFRVFRDEDREYLTRAWLIEPSGPAAGVSEPRRERGEWNGEYYVSFGIYKNRVWDEAVEYGFIGASGGPWYSRTLDMLEPGDRIWTNIPAVGYVGVGIVTSKVVPVEEFIVIDKTGKSTPIIDLPIKAANMRKTAEYGEDAANLVGVNWIKTVPVTEAVREKGFFGNQNTVARPRTPKWDHTVERLKKRFGVD